MKYLKETAALLFLFILGNILLVPIGMYFTSKWEGYIESNGYYDILFGILWMLTIIYYGSKIHFAVKKGYIASPFYALISVLTGLSYIIQRFCVNYFLFYGFSYLSFIAYLDFIIIGTVLNIVLYLSGKTQEETTKPTSFFYTDNPNEAKGENIFEGRIKAAETLAERITETYSERAFAIAIEGEWGTGKTVFLNQIYEVLKKKKQSNQILIEFNPWDGNMPNSIIENFFAVLSHELGQYSSQLSWQINRYMDNLISSNDSTLVNGILHFFKSFFGSSALSTQFAHINTTLKKLNKQLVIFIDDIDRLDKEEIYQVVKLIRNTANFYNTVFIAAFDRPYVVEALKVFNEHNHNLFLEKIFQLEMQLPEIDNRKVLNVFGESLIKFINKEYKDNSVKCNSYKQITEDIIGKRIPLIANDYQAAILTNHIMSGKIKFPIISDYLVTVRDANRFLNVIKLLFPNIEGEVCFRDFLLIELLKFKYPNICKELFIRTELYLRIEGKQYVIKKYSNDRKNHLNQIDVEYHDKFSDGIEHIIVTEGYENNSKEASSIRGIMESLLTPAFVIDQDKTITKPSNFHKYFSYGLFDGDFPHKEFDNLRQYSSQEEFLSKLEDWNKEGKTDAVFEKFENIKHFDDERDVEKVFSVFFSFCDKIQQDTSYYDSFVRFVEYIHKTSESNYKEILHDFLKTLCKEKATFPYLFALNTLSSIDWIEDVVKIELYLKYFEEHLKKGNAFQEIFSIYNLLIKLNSEQKDDLKYRLCNFIQTKAFKSFFENTIYTNNFQKMSSVLMVNNSFIIEFFETQENYEKFLDELKERTNLTDDDSNKEKTNLTDDDSNKEKTNLTDDDSNKEKNNDSNVVKEYIDYYEKCKKNNFNPIEFPFKYLKSPFA